MDKKTRNLTNLNHQKKKKTEILQLKNAVTEQNSLESFKSSLRPLIGRISKLEDRTFEIIQSEEPR